MIMELFDEEIAPLRGIYDFAGARHVVPLRLAMK